MLSVKVMETDVGHVLVLDVVVEALVVMLVLVLVVEEPDRRVSVVAHAFEYSDEIQ